MSRMPLLSGREAGRVFEKAGFEYHHQTGSHMIYYHFSGRHSSIPDHRELGRGILRKLIRHSGLSPVEFGRLLGNPGISPHPR